MREVNELHQLKALPLCVCVRTQGGQFRSRDEDGRWSQIGLNLDKDVLWDETDLPAKVVWSYAEEIGAPEVEALARMASVMIQQQARAQVIQEAQAAQVQAQFQQEQAGAQSNGHGVVDTPTDTPTPVQEYRDSEPATPQN